MYDLQEERFQVKHSRQLQSEIVTKTSEEATFAGNDKEMIVVVSEAYLTATNFKNSINITWTKVYSLLELCFIISIAYHRTEEFIIALANYVVSWGVRITYRQDNFLLTFYN